MDTTTLLTCLESAGLVTEAQRSAFAKVIARLPETDNGLLQVIAAASIVGGDDSFNGTPISVESITSTGTGDVKTLTVPTGATRAIVSVFTNNIIFRTDGGTPAAATGHTGLVSSNFNIGSLSDFKFISAVAGSATIFVSYF